MSTDRNKGELRGSEGGDLPLSLVFNRIHYLFITRDAVVFTSCSKEMGDSVYNLFRISRVLSIR